MIATTAVLLTLLGTPLTHDDAASLPTSSLKTLKVVTTTQDLAAIVAAVGRNRVTASSIVVGARDPHKIEAKPSYMSRVSGADLFVAIGLDLEIGWERAVIDGSRNARVRPGEKGHLYASLGVPVLDKPSGSVTRAQGDVHPYGNPHIWTDPYNGRIIARRIALKLAALDPGNDDFFKANAEAFVERIDRAMFGAEAVGKFGAEKLWQWAREGDLVQRAGSALGGWAEKMAPYRGRAIVTYHRSWTYFANRFGLKIVAELEPKPGIDPTPGHVASVVRIAQQAGAKVILQEPYYSTRNANFLASRTGAKVVVAPLSVGSDAAASDYVALMDTIVLRVLRGFG